MTEWLADTLVATTLLMAAVLALRAPVARLFGARIAYALWLIPAARLFMPALTRTVEAQPMPAEATGLSPETLAWLASHEAQSPDWTVALLTLWFGGALLLLLWRLAAYAAERDEVLEFARPVERIGSIELVETPAIQGPIAFGLLRRYIVVPPAFFRHYDDRERALILAHELSHHRAGDLAIRFGAFLMLCLHWFNPIAWFAWRAFKFDQEAACDARVLAGAEPGDRAVYGRAVAKAASGRPLLFASALDRTNSLKKRLRTMTMNNTSRKRRFAGLLMIGGALAAALPLTATVNYASAAVQPADAPEPPSAPNAPVPPEAPTPPEARHAAHVILVHTDVEQGEERHERRIERRIIRHGGEEFEIPSEEEIRAMIPDIEIEQGCSPDGEIVRSEHGVTADGQRQRIHLVICGEERTREARARALEGLREARETLARDEHLGAELRARITADLDRAIERMSRQTN